MTKLNGDIVHNRCGDHLDGHLERALAGNASSAARSELDQHAKTCAACAALLELGPPLASSIGKDRADDQHDRRLVARALAVPGRRRRAILPVGLAAAAVLLVSLAGAQYLGVRFPWVSHAKETMPAKSPPRAAVLPEKTPEAPEANVAASEDQSPANESKPRVQPAPRADAPADTAGDLFAQANQLRRRGQDAQAIAAYRKLQQTYPQSGEATLSHATLGALLLQSGDTKGALAQFDAYIAHGGPVLEEALSGRARALGQLGDRAGEAKAWQSLLDRFPNSVQAARARSRLDELR